MKLSFCKGTADHKLFDKVINQGIDSHLEGFCNSNFSDDGIRITCNFADNERATLCRRLDELKTDESDSWVFDIIVSYYGVELNY